MKKNTNCRFASVDHLFSLLYHMPLIQQLIPANWPNGEVGEAALLPPPRSELVNSVCNTFPERGCGVSDPPDHESPLAEAFRWLSRIAAVVTLMVAPGLGGYWLDERWGTNFLGLVGFAVGLVLGMVSLVAITRAADSGPGTRPSGGRGSRDGDEGRGRGSSGE